MSRQIKSFWYLRDLYKVLILIAVAALITPSSIIAATLQNQTGTLWAPYVEWSMDNPSYTGNPFDIIATVTFTHGTSGETRTTEMFYAGGTSWKFRFAGTKTGPWTFTTGSPDLELNGHTGQVTIEPNPGVYGFVTNAGNQWARQKEDAGSLEAFVPQFRVAFNEIPAEWTPSQMDNEIQTHMVTEGFNGVFFFVAGRWVDINASGAVFTNNDPDPTMFQALENLITRWVDINATDAVFTNNDPDPAMFQVLENLITKTHVAGGVVHLWYNGDCSRRQCVQAGFGSNGARSDGEKRLLRYIGARLAALPGWIMGYGYDIPEDTTTDDLRGWGNYLRSKMGWQHFLGARDQISSSSYSFWPEADWYSKGNFFYGASYDSIVDVFDSDTTVPHSFDERWWTSRISEDNQRRQLWNNMMGGGVSAIWGADGRADPYVNPDWFKTHFTFWTNRWINGMVRDNSLTNGKGLRTNDYRNYVFYSEGTSTLTYDLSNAPGVLHVIAVDTKSQYVDIDLGIKAANSYTWTPPYQSDWALAVGEFTGTTRTTQTTQ